MLCFTLIAIVGCSNNVKVTGKVTLPDGTPVTQARVIFISGVNQGTGETDQNGTYSLSFTGQNDGVPKGEYQVLVNGFFSPANYVSTDEMDTGTVPMLDLVYAETETSPLKCSVPSDSGYDFTVKPSEAYAKEKGITLE